MITENNTQYPDYRQIYTDILNKKFAHKKDECEELLSKKILSAIDIIELNNKIFGKNTETEKFNQRYRSYNKSSILKILDYQKEHQINNSELAKHFNLSRNTVTKWKKLFLV
jgi:PIN domain nuclease of toxin-antitoxin system